MSVVLLLVAAALAAAGTQPDSPDGKDPDVVRDRPTAEPAILFEDFAAYPAGQPWFDGERHGQWRAVYDGYGRTEIIDVGAHRLSMAPRVAADRDLTHGGLVTTLATFDDIELTVTLRTVRQLRPRKANSWEVAWVLWNYTDDLHFYSVVLKPDGWELGKEDPAYPGAQRFLRTGTTPSFPVGEQHIVRVRQVANTITVWANGRRLTSYTDNERPYSSGKVGLYTEDAQVNFDRVLVRRP